ncbi:MAG: Planctomycete cytochrome, partial [Armatimonadetes bacterium]|nr:Planctomycete cytochrome [Armatimonadota bacterium]
MRLAGSSQSRFTAILALTLPLAAAGVASSAPATPAAVTPRPTPADLTFFESRVRPLLAKHCYSCHSQKIAQGGLRLDDGVALRKGGDSGPALVPGKPEESRILEAIRYTNPHLQMPPSGKIPAADIQTLTTWVTQGAPWPAPAPTQPSAAGAAAAKARLNHWAFQPLRRTSPPAVKQQAWPARRIDQYLLARIEKAGLHPSPRADRRTLIRRAYFDLVGLPPTPAEIDAFLADPAPDAYPRLIERLLAAPAYGERWGRHWLDLVRYCDVPEPWAQAEAQPWLYRDWVVKALNDDLPYDQFILRQLAADQVEGLPPTELAATGFIGLSPSYWKELKLAPDVIKAVVAEEWEERITAVSGTFLGLTVACARCHDHKFDPVSQKDYYALAGVFASTRLTPRPLLARDEAQKVIKARAAFKVFDAEAKGLLDRAAKEPAKAKELTLQADAARQKAVAAKASTPDFDAPFAYAVEDAYLDVLPDGPDHTQLAYRDGEGRDIEMQLRGNPAKPGAVVPRGFLTVLSGGKQVRFTRGSGRREFAEAMIRESAALTARVMVNRVWKHHFGTGIVETPSNFGLQGDRPTHPELLDDLSARFIENGWSLKWLHREIMRSSAYQQAS